MDMVFFMDRKKLAIDFAKSLNYPEIEKIILFGSVARGKDKDESDIDILILTTDEDKITDKVYDKVVDVILKFQELISLKIISVDEYNIIKNTPFISNILKEGIILRRYC